MEGKLEKVQQYICTGERGKDIICVVHVLIRSSKMTSKI